MEGDNPPRYLEDAGNGTTKLQRESEEEHVCPVNSVTTQRRWASARQHQHWVLPGAGEGGNPCDEMVERPPVLGQLLISLYLFVSLLTNFELDGQKSFFLSL